MKHLFKVLLSLLCLSSFLIYATSIHAAEQEGGSNLFKYQELKANKGDAKAQYNVAIMYENGAGINKNEKLAKHWYKKAADQGNSDARMREIYLEVKSSGYKQDHGTWLKMVKAATQKGDAQARFLLAQLYRQGIGVKQDLVRAKQLCDQITVFEVPYVYQELALLQKLNDDTSAKKSASFTSPPLAMVKIQDDTPAVKASKQVVKVIDQQAQAAKLMAEKRRHYEQVMLKLKREQQQIDELQASMSHDKTIGVDEEF